MHIFLNSISMYEMPLPYVYAGTDACAALFWLTIMCKQGHASSASLSAPTPTLGR